MNWLEERNYWNDPRTIESQVKRRYKVVRGEGRQLRLVVDAEWLEYVEDRFSDGERSDLAEGVVVASRFVACETCSGYGKVVDPNIDCGGISDDDFSRDPDFKQDYLDGRYDVTCPKCSGDRVVAKIQLSECNELVRRVWNELQSWEKTDRESAREYAAERAMGA